MFTNWGKASLVAAALACSVQAQALEISVGSTIGRVWTEVIPKFDKSQRFGQQTHEYSAFANAQVEESLPIAVGLKASLGDIRNRDVGPDNKTSYGYEFTPELMAWLPSEWTGIEQLTPYGKLSYLPEAFSNYTLEYNSDGGEKVTGRVSGFQVGLGATFAITDQVSVLGEYIATLKNIRFEQDGEKGDRHDYRAQGLLFGAQVRV